MLKLYKRLGPVAILASTMVVFQVTQVSTAAAVYGKPSIEAPYRDYLSTESGVTFGGVGSDQCSLPLSSRQGKWWCPGKSGGFADVVSAGVKTNSTAYCNSSGCYNRYDDYHVDFGSNYGNWGYGSKVLGKEGHYVNWQLSGAQDVSKPVQYTNSVATQNVIFTGDLINAAAGQTGTAVAGKFSLYNAGNIAAGSTKRWDPNGYKSYDNTQFDHSQVHQFSWEYPGYSGYWYSYVKSVVSHSATKTIYKFNAVSSLPASPFGGGYRS